MTLALGGLGIFGFLCFIAYLFKVRRENVKLLKEWGKPLGYRSTKHGVKGKVSGKPFNFFRLSEASMGSTTSKIVLRVDNIAKFPLLEVLPKVKLGYPIVHKIWNRPPDHIVNSSAIFSVDGSFAHRVACSGLHDFLENRELKNLALVIHEGYFRIEHTSVFDQWTKDDFELAMSLAKITIEILNELNTLSQHSS